MNNLSNLGMSRLRRMVFFSLAVFGLGLMHWAFALVLALTVLPTTKPGDALFFALAVVVLTTPLKLMESYAALSTVFGKLLPALAEAKRNQTAMGIVIEEILKKSNFGKADKTDAGS